MREISETTGAPAFWPKFAWLFWLISGVVLGRYLFPVERVDVKPVDVVQQPVSVAVPVPVRLVEVKPTAEPDRLSAQSPWSQLREGLTEAEVLALLGAPSRKEFVGQTRTYWCYGEGANPPYVDFFGGQAYRWQAPSR